LTGLHAAVSCERCHSPEPAAKAVRYKGLNFSDCASCHRDPHRGAFPASCTQCHSTSGWRSAKATITSNFDHSRTDYPLMGRHTALECRACHRTSDFSAPIRSARCTDCHTDKHSGQFARRADLGDCGSCHTLDGFKKSTFGLTAHASARYPLTGKHSQAACAACHLPQGEKTDYYPQSKSCTNCHRDAHASQFNDKYADQCETCHRVEGFKPSTYTLARHRQSRFDLAGAHVAVACIACHSTSAKPDPGHYRFPDTACAACHKDPHDSAPGQAVCQTCHTERSWSPARPFNHKTTRYPLLGAHQRAACTACHKPDQAAAGQSIRFRGAPVQCAQCHEDIHASQFVTRTGGNDCTSCHSPLRWKPSGFDHARSDFPLDGAHRDVPCAACHNKPSVVNGKQALVYSAAPKECVSCH
jgi:hypothetical protein